MQRVIVIVSGDVQRVGYRDVVEGIARKLGLTGYVENLKPYDVRIVAEGEKIAEFMKKIEIKKVPIFVEKLDVKYEEPTGEFKYFEIRRGTWQDEMGERMDAASKLLYQNVELSRQSVEIGKTMLEKQDKTIEVIGTRFDDMDAKYSEISITMKSMDKKLDKLTNLFEKLVNHFVR